MIFHLHTVVSCPEVIQLVLQICLIISSTFLCEQLFSLVIRKKFFEISSWPDTNSESNKNTNFKSEINKVSTNKRCQFLENILPINETSEQNSNGYFNVEFTLNQINASFICGIKVTFTIINLYLFSKCVPSDFKYLSSLWFDMRSICYLLCNNMHSYRRGKWHCKCKQ
jgi:hypothetical protein